MKTVYNYLIIIFFITSFSCNAQETIVSLELQHEIDINTPEETIIYFKDVNNTLDKFTGDWLFDDGTHYLKITITKGTHVAKGIPNLYNDNDFEDRLVLKMVYRLNSVEKYNTTGGIGGNIIINNNKIELNYYEPSLINCRRRKSGRLQLEFINNLPGNEQLIWTRTNLLTEGWGKCPDGSYEDDSDFLIPANLTLTKQ